MDKDIRELKNYARAAVDIGRSLGVLEKLETEMKTVTDKITSDLDLKNYLGDKSKSQNERIGAILDIFKNSPTPAIKTMMTMIVALEAVNEIDSIYEIFTGLVSDHKKQTYVEVISAIELDSSTVKKIKKDLDRVSGFDVRIGNTVDDSIIGGIIIKIGEKVMDLSVKRRLEDIKAKLKSVELGGKEFGA